MQRYADRPSQDRVSVSVLLFVCNTPPKEKVIPTFGLGRKKNDYLAQIQIYLTTAAYEDRPPPTDLFKTPPINKAQGTLHSSPIQLHTLKLCRTKDSAISLQTKLESKKSPKPNNQSH